MHVCTNTLVIKRYGFKHCRYYKISGIRVHTNNVCKEHFFQKANLYRRRVPWLLLLLCNINPIAFYTFPCCSYIGPKNLSKRIYLKTTKIIEKFHSETTATRNRVVRRFLLKFSSNKPTNEEKLPPLPKSPPKREKIRTKYVTCWEETRFITKMHFSKKKHV